MDVVLQRHCAKYIYAVPEGLRELMSDITREVLRSQPENLYTFIADYLDALMITRENARVAARLVEHITEISETIVNLLIRTGMTREEADDVARVIQNAFRRYLQRKEKQKIAEVYGIEEEEEEEMEGEGEGLQYMSEEFEEEHFINEVLNESEIDDDNKHNAARIIQAAFRKFKKRQELEKDIFFGMVDWRIAAKHTISLYRHAGVSEWEANRAATLIKAAYKGFYTRRIMRKLLEKSIEEEAEDSINSQGSSSAFSQATGSEFSADTDDSQKKSVRINFDTVIPHVDFDETSTVITVPLTEAAPPPMPVHQEMPIEDKPLETILEAEEPGIEEQKAEPHIEEIVTSAASSPGPSAPSSAPTSRAPSAPSSAPSSRGPSAPSSAVTSPRTSASREHSATFSPPPQSESEAGKEEPATHEHPEASPPESPEPPSDAASSPEPDSGVHEHREEVPPLVLEEGQVSSGQTSPMTEGGDQLMDEQEEE